MPERRTRTRASLPAWRGFATESTRARPFRKTSASTSSTFSRRRCGEDVREGEVPALEEELGTAHDGERIREEVSVVQPRGVAAFAVSRERATSYGDLLRVHGNELDGGLLDEEVEIADAFEPVARFEDERCLEERGDRDDAQSG